MKVAMVVHNAVRHDSRVLREAEALHSAGHDVSIFGLSSDRSETFVFASGVKVHLTKRDVSGISALLTSRGLPGTAENKVWASFTEQGRQVFDSVKSRMVPDVVHIHDHVCLTAASSYSQTFGSPIIWDAHEIYEELAGLEDVRRNVNPRIIRENVGLIDGFVTLNESIAGVYAERYADLPEAVLIPNATRFSSVPDYDGRMHRQAALSGDQRILLFQGGFSEHRGIPVLLDVAAKLDSRWSVVFMGWGKLENQIRQRALELDDRPNGRARIAVVPGAAHSELALWTAGASLGAIPYEDIGLNHRYCTPNKLWEFPASGVPILATDLPEMAARIHHAGMGLTVSPDLNADNIARAINDLSDEDLCQFRRGAVDFIQRDSWAQYESKLLGLYQEMVPQRQGIRGRLKMFMRRL